MKKKAFGLVILVTSVLVVCAVATDTRVLDSGAEAMSP